jgi:hypothetical protein
VPFLAQGSLSMKLSIVSHYYGNAPAVEKVLSSFRAMATDRPGSFDFVLIDDHSHEPINPILFEGVEGLRVFRIVEDVRWNMPAARNIGVREALCEKILLMDIDHIIEPSDVDVLLTDAESLPQGAIGSFRRMKKTDGAWREVEPHINSFMIHKADFLAVGGYEEQFSGNYGHEDKFFKICCKRNGLTRVMLSTVLFVRGSSTPDLDRDKSANTVILDRLLESKATKAQKTMAYSWTALYP